MINSFFVSDLHGKKERIDKLIGKIKGELPHLVFIGGDLLPHFAKNSSGDFLKDYLLPEFVLLKRELHDKYPVILVILGNDDPKPEESVLNCGEKLGLWHYINNKHFTYKGYRIFGYNFVPPTPFQLKDWEKYDVSRYVDPGCISPEEGKHSYEIDELEIRNSTIQKDLNDLSAEYPMNKSIFLFHAPPYQSHLDRASLDGKSFDHAPLDVHVGSIAIKYFIEKKRPLITMHGHIHESARLTGAWRERIGITYCFNASYDGSELSLIKFSIEEPEKAVRELL
jgi:uncharacterized protein